MKRSKKYLNAQKSFSSEKLYSVNKAVSIVKEGAYANFDETVELAFRLGIDPKQADQAIRGTLSLPHGTGKDVRVVVICGEEDIQAAKDAGACDVGSEDMVDKISKGWLDFDVVVSTPAMMGKVGKLGKILGARGLMPSPKSGTVTQSVAKTVSEFKSGKIEYRNDKMGNVHLVLGKVSFTKEQLVENFNEVYDTIQKAKPQKSKGTYIHSLVISSTIGPGIKICPTNTFEKEG